MRSLLTLTTAFVRRDILVARSYRLALATQLFGRLSTLLVFFFLGVAVGSPASLSSYGGDYFSFALVGLALAEPAWAALSVPALKVRQAQIEGTLEALLMGPSSPWLIVALNGTGGMLMGWFRLVLFIAVGALALGANLSFSGVGLALVAVLLLVIAQGAIGLIAASVTLAFKRGDPIAGVTHVVSGLLAGLLYPLSVLPDWMQSLANIVPLTHGLEACRVALLTGGSFDQIAGHIGALGLFCAVLVPLSLIAFRAAHGYAMRRGTLTHF